MNPPPPSPATKAPSAQGNRLGPDVVIKGTLKVREPLHFNARLEGGIVSGSEVEVAEQAVITGDISGGSVMLRGRVEGNVTASVKVELKAGGELHGDLTARKVEIEEGSTFVGQARIAAGKR